MGCCLAQKKEQWKGTVIKSIVTVKRASTSSLLLKEAETRTNRWILQEDKILIKEIKAGHRGPAMEWIASRGGVLLWKEFLDESPF